MPRGRPKASAVAEEVKTSRTQVAGAKLYRCYLGHETYWKAIGGGVLPKCLFCGASVERI